MGAEAFNKKPVDIQESMLSDNKKHLRGAARKGARVVNFNREKRRVEEEIWQEVKVQAAAYEEADRRRSTNEDILSPDGEAVED